MNRLNASSILTTLAALGTSALMGCAATPPASSPVQASEVAGPSGSSKSAASCGAVAGCSAADCGAKGPTKVDAPVNPKGNEVASPTSDTPKTDAPGAATADPTKTEGGTAKPVAKKKPMKKAGGQGAAGSCGQGTCDADAPPAGKK
jgi:hypothetical protein